jgi:ECF transporter S component (folate family)
MEGKSAKRGFFAEKFKNSAKNIAEVRAVVTSGLMVAMAVALRAFSVALTPDIRVTFAFVPICVVAMLYGPVVCMLSAFAADVIGFLFDATGRFYSPQLAAVVLLSALLYGVLLYGNKGGFGLCLRAAIARTAVVFICNICLNSYFIYKIYVNAAFDIFDPSGYDAFFAWGSLRIGKNLLLLPFDLVLLCVVLPVASAAYNRLPKIAGEKPEI